MYRDTIKGIITPIVTPMREDETVNVEELRRQVRRQLENGIHGIFTTGTNGEGFILSEEERLLVLRTVVEEVNGRVPVYAGSGCVGTGDTVRLSRQMQEAGADVLSVITPSFAAASQEELYEHYRAVAEAVTIPVLLYNIPARTGNHLEPETVQRLSEVEGIAGIKDSSGNFDNMLQYMELTKGRDFVVLAGSDSLILKNFAAGGSGAISGCANVYPQNMKGIYDCYCQGRMDEAQQCQDAIASFRALFRYGSSVSVIKAAMRLMGFSVGECRRPFGRLSEEGIEALKQVLAENERQGMR